MAATPSSNPKPSGDDRNAPGDVPVALTFEERLTQFWEKNRMIVLALCALVLVAILGKGLWQRYQASREHRIESAYEKATTPDQLRAFAAAHPDDVLAGIAELRLADQAYSAGKYQDAVAGYAQALARIKTGPLAARAKLGHALSSVEVGNRSQATTELKEIFNDTTQFTAARAEAGYQLASLAADEGNAAEVRSDAEQVARIDPTSPWTQRAMMLRATLPDTGAAAAMAAPAAATPAAAKPAPGGPEVKLNIPGK